MSDQILKRSVTSRRGFWMLRLKMRHFVYSRLKELSYAGFFSSVFFLCQSPLQALVIDDIRVLSRLGEPFQAEIVVTPAAGETLTRSCFSSPQGSGDLPGINNVRLSLTRQLNTQVLRVRGTNPMREPMSEFVLQIRCPGVPTMVRSFLVMIDPPGLDEPQTLPIAADTQVLATSGIASATARRVRAVTASQNDRPITPGTRYTVAVGDMLSTIAARVAGRPDWSVWPIAQQIYQANPGAFLMGNPNVIAQGASIYIPPLDQIDFNAPASVREVTKQNATAQPSSRSRATSGSGPVAGAAVAPVTTSPLQSGAQAPAASSLAAQAPVVTALPGMQLTTALFNESRMKLELRRQGVSTPPAVTAAPTQPASTPNTVPADPEPERLPERPVATGTVSRDILTADNTQSRSGFNWLLIIAGLLVGLLAGAFAASVLLRRRLHDQYAKDLREVARIREHQDGIVSGPGTRPEPAVPATDAGPSKPATATTIDTDTGTLQLAGLDSAEMPANSASTDQTVKVSAMPGLDFELPDTPQQTARTVTVETPEMLSALDLELTEDDTARSGQHDVDFDLLERAYSEEYQAEYLAPTVKTPAATDPTESAANTDASEDDPRYYHLENRDPADDTPLAIEMDGDVTDGGPADDDRKVVRFPKHSSSG